MGDIPDSHFKLTEEELKVIYSGDRKVESFEEDGYFKYYIAEELNYLAAEQILDECGVDGSFIAVYKKGNNHRYYIAALKHGNKIFKITIYDDLAKSSYEMDDLQYRVQIVASKTKLNDEQLKLIYSGDRKIEYFKEDGYYKYYIAQKSNYFTAKQILIESGVQNGFIAAYRGGIKHNLQDAMAAQYRKRMLRDIIDVKDTILNVVTVNFNFNEFVLPPGEMSKLKDFVANHLKNQVDPYVIVNGHTDARGSDTYNFGLSEERALFVKQMIIDEGISSERVKSFYFGESKLAKYCDEHENCGESVHEANRRVEIFLLSAKSDQSHVRNSTYTLK